MLPFNTLRTAAIAAILVAAPALAQDSGGSPPPAKDASQTPPPAQTQPSAKDAAAAKAKAAARDKAKDGSTGAKQAKDGDKNKGKGSDKDQGKDKAKDTGKSGGDADAGADKQKGDGSKGDVKKAAEPQYRPCKPIDQLPPELHEIAQKAMNPKYRDFTRLAAMRQELYVKSSALRMAMRGGERTERQIAEVAEVQADIGKIGDKMDGITMSKGWTQDDFVVMDFIVQQQTELNPIQ